MKKFYWVHKDYKNDGLNSLARRVTEHNTADLLLSNREVHYRYELPDDDTECRDVGLIQLCEPQSKFPYTVQDVHVVNDIFNYNLYFKNNTEPDIEIPDKLKGTFDCLVSLAAGQMIEINSKETEIYNGNHYVIDISPTAIHKTMGLYKDNVSDFQQLDIFNTDAVKDFLRSCKGTKGLFHVSNCFNYIVNSLIYDVNYRLEIQNRFIDALVEDKKEWYVSMYSADGTFYQCVNAEEVMNKKLDERFGVLPWINQ